MKAREIEALSTQYLLPHLPGFAAKGAVVFMEPLVYLLRGFWFDTSSFTATDFYVNMSVHPLYVLQPNMGCEVDRLASASVETRPPADEMDRLLARPLAEEMASVLKAMQGEGLRFLSAYPTPWQLARPAGLLFDTRTPYQIEVAAYTWVLCGRTGRAVKDIHRLQAAIERGRPWRDCLAMDERCERSQRVLEALSRDPKEAVRLLIGWTEENVRKLHLLKYWRRPVA